MHTWTPETDARRGQRERAAVTQVGLCRPIGGLEGGAEPRLRRVGKIKGRKSADGSGSEAAGTRGKFTDVFPSKRGLLTVFYRGEKLQVS